MAQRRSANVLLFSHSPTSLNERFEKTISGWGANPRLVDPTSSALPDVVEYDVLAIVTGSMKSQHIEKCRRAAHDAGHYLAFLPIQTSGWPASFKEACQRTYEVVEPDTAVEAPAPSQVPPFQYAKQALSPSTATEPPPPEPASSPRYEDLNDADRVALFDMLMSENETLGIANRRMTGELENANEDLLKARDELDEQRRRIAELEEEVRKLALSTEPSARYARVEKAATAFQALVELGLESQESCDKKLLQLLRGK